MKNQRIIIPKGVLMSHWCSNCGGTGKMKCRICDGYGTMMDKSTCYYCQGARTVTCSACDGTGVIQD